MNALFCPGQIIGAHSLDSADSALLPSWLTILVPRANRFNGLNNEAKSPLAFPRLPELDLNAGVVVEDDTDEIASVPP